MGRRLSFLVLPVFDHQRVRALLSVSRFNFSRDRSSSSDLINFFLCCRSARASLPVRPPTAMMSNTDRIAPFFLAVDNASVLISHGENQTQAQLDFQISAMTYVLSIVGYNLDGRKFSHTRVTRPSFSTFSLYCNTPDPIDI